MKEETRKEIEAKWHQLITEADRGEKTKPALKSALIGAKIIRRRKGQIDTPIT